MVLEIHDSSVMGAYGGIYVSWTILDKNLDSVNIDVLILTIGSSPAWGPEGYPRA
jgi:hypothetical protein